MGKNMETFNSIITLDYFQYPAANSFNPLNQFTSIAGICPYQNQLWEFTIIFSKTCLVPPRSWMFAAWTRTINRSSIVSTITWRFRHSLFCLHHSRVRREFLWFWFIDCQEPLHSVLDFDQVLFSIRYAAKNLCFPIIYCAARGGSRNILLPWREIVRQHSPCATLTYNINIALISPEMIAHVFCFASFYVWECVVRFFPFFIR